MILVWLAYYADMYFMSCIPGEPMHYTLLLQACQKMLVNKYAIDSLAFFSKLLPNIFGHFKLPPQPVAHKLTINLYLLRVSHTNFYIYSVRQRSIVMYIDRLFHYAVIV